MSGTWQRWALGGLGQQWRAVRASGPGRTVRIPVVTLVITAIPIVFAAATHPLDGIISHSVTLPLGWSAQRVADGGWWRVVTAIPITRDPFMLWGMVFSILLAVGALEYLGGRLRAALTFIYGSVGAYVGVTIIVLTLRAVGVSGAAHWATTHDYGASAGVAACAGALVVMLRRPLIVVGATLFIIGGLVLHHQIADWEHAFSFATVAVFTYLTTEPPVDSAELIGARQLGDESRSAQL